MLLTARWLLTGATPPLKDGAVLIDGETIREIGTRKWFARKDIADVIDLGEAILIPGLVNAHCHLEHSALKGKISPKTPFTEWVRRLQELDPKISPAEREKAVEGGIQELIRGGTTTLVDHRSPDSPPIQTPFREVTLLEIVGANREKARRNLELAGDLPATPHSLYAVHESVLQKLTPRSLHLLESEDEDQFFRSGSGPLADLVSERGGDVPFPSRSPVAWLKEFDRLGPELLLIHANYLTDDEIRLLCGTGTTVIHCPGSHRFFGHRRFPLEGLGRAEVPIALGTDSLASSDSLGMLRQMRLMRESYPTLGEEDLLRIATVNAAQALGLEEEIGTIEIGKKADMVGIPLLKKEADPYEALLLSEEVKFSMIGGRVILRTDL